MKMTFRIVSVLTCLVMLNSSQSKAGVSDQIVPISSIQSVQPQLSSDEADLDNLPEPAMPGRRFRQGPGPGPGGPRDGSGPGRDNGGRRDGNDQNDRRGPGWGGFFGQVDSEKLLAFLNEHESELAKKLTKVKEENEEEFNRKIAFVGRIYGPVMWVMEHNRDAGMVALEKIRLQMKIERTIQMARNAETDQAKKEAWKPLKGYLEKMFDLIIKQEGYRLEFWQERMKEWQDSEQARDGDKKGNGDRDDREDNDRRRGDGPPMGMGPGGPGGPPGDFRRGGPDRSRRGFNSRLEHRQAQLEIWQKNKANIVQARLFEIMQESTPFPWDDF